MINPHPFVMREADAYIIAIEASSGCAQTRSAECRQFRNRSRVVSPHRRKGGQRTARLDSRAIAPAIGFQTQEKCIHAISSDAMGPGALNRQHLATPNALGWRKLYPLVRIQPKTPHHASLCAHRKRITARAIRDGTMPSARAGKRQNPQRERTTRLAALRIRAIVAGVVAQTALPTTKSSSDRWSYQSRASRVISTPIRCALARNCASARHLQPATLPSTDNGPGN
jgi:hypothetical protein